MADLGVFQAIHSLRAIRRYKREPIPDAFIYQVLDAAIRGPSAVNTQPWRYLVVTDPATRANIARLYHKTWADGQKRRRDSDGAPAFSNEKVLEHAAQFANSGIFMVPAFVFVWALNPIAYDSVIQGVQNMMLAARGLGMGTLFTTLLRRHEDTLKFDLGIPDEYAFVCMIPMGYPDEPFGPVKRRPVHEVSYRDYWGQQLPTES